MSVVNTALAFSLWNHVLKKLRAFELSVLQNTMLIQTGILVTIFPGETLTATKFAVMMLVFVGDSQRRMPNQDRHKIDRSGNSLTT